MAWGHDDDEFTKRFDTMLLASPAMLVIDNCNNRLLRGDTLEMAISEGQATIRLFTKLEAITVQSRTFIMPDGNNIQISGDMSRRSIKISILPRSASPERDTFPFTPENYVIEHRVSLLNDYYTIMRAYRCAGMPHSGLPAVGSFSEWERKVRDLVWWLTGYDLSEEFDKNKKDDPEQQNDAALLAALRDYFGEKWFKAAEADAAMKRATEHRRYGGLGTANVAEQIQGRKMPLPQNRPTLKQSMRLFQPSMKGPPTWRRHSPPTIVLVPLIPKSLTKRGYTLGKWHMQQRRMPFSKRRSRNSALSRTTLRRSGIGQGGYRISSSTVLSSTGRKTLTPKFSD